MIQKTFDEFITKAKAKMQRKGNCFKIGDRCYVFSYIRDIAAAKAFKDIITEINYGLEKFFSSIFFIATITSKVPVRVAPANRIAKVHTIKSAIWTENTDESKNIASLITLSDPVDIIRERFKVAYMNQIGDMLKSVVFARKLEAQRKVQEMTKQKPARKIIRA